VTSGPADFGGPEYEGCNEHLVLTRPDVVREMHEGYPRRGRDLIETDTFGGTRIVLAEYACQDKVGTSTSPPRASRARRARASRRPDRPRFVAGSMGPGTKTISVTGGVTFDRVIAAYAEQTRALVEGGVDVLFLETQQDTLNVKAGAPRHRRGLRAVGRTVPSSSRSRSRPWARCSPGQSIEAVYCLGRAPRSSSPMGLNCATGRTS
jgi:5-methyltetrahydrofolate--homocysteine methyltransferase